jgi:acyl carrier protein
MNLEEDLIAYINEEIMQGHSMDLEATTPLLELNVIDSVSLVMLTEHIKARHGVKIPSSLLTPEHLKDVRSIAQLIARLQSPAHSQ